MFVMRTWGQSEEENLVSLECHTQHYQFVLLLPIVPPMYCQKEKQTWTYGKCHYAMTPIDSIEP